jgi:phytoene desaturase
MTTPVPSLPGKRACVIGAGLGGLALAIRLQAAGTQTVLVEAREAVGGCAWATTRDGFTFDGGPTAITDPASLGDLWALTGHDIAEDIELMPISPFYRLNWPDGTTFDVTGDETAMAAEVARIAPGDLAGYEDFLDYAAAAFAEVHPRLDKGIARDVSALLRALPAFARLQAWRSLHAIASSHVRSDRLREALSVQTLVFGGNPFTTSAVYALVHTLERQGGVWWPRGGTARRWPGPWPASSNGWAASCGSTIRCSTSTPSATARTRWKRRAAGANGLTRWRAMPTSSIPIATCWAIPCAGRNWRGS